MFPNSPLRRLKSVTASPEILEAMGDRRVSFFPLIATPGGFSDRIRAAHEHAVDANYGWMYQTQPSVRSVVDFISRNVAQLALRLYERTSDIERHESSDHPAAETLRKPNPQTPGQKFIFNLVRDHLVYGNAFALKSRVSAQAPLVLSQLPPFRVSALGPSYFTVDAWRVYRTDGTHLEPDPGPNDVLHWPAATDPSDPRIGLSPLETLRQVLAEDAASQKANVELMKAGLMKPGYIARPLDAPQLSNEAAQAVVEKWANDVRNSTRTTPMLEEGMEHRDFGITPKDAEMLSGRRFTKEEVCGVYGLPKTLVGVGEPTQEDRDIFYADVLPPLCEMLASHLDLSILKTEFMVDDFYFEFDLDEKLMGNDRLTALTSACGAPPITRNEARAMLDKPPKEGGDELITPLNVTVGGKPSPQVMPIQDPNKPAQDGSARSAAMNGHGKSIQFIGRRMAQLRRRDKWAAQYTEALRKHFTHQERSTRSGKADPQPNAEGQNSALAKILAALMLKQIAEEGDVAAHRLMLPSFDMGQVQNFVKKVSLDEATQINNETAGALLENPAVEVFDYAKTTRAEGAGEFFATRFSSFAHIEAAKQTPDASDRTKTWVVADLETSAHPEMDNQTVGLTEHFSNGKAYPPYEHPRCACLVEIS